MQRQKSILSFLQKPSPANQKSGGDTPNGSRAPNFPGKQHSQNVVVANQPTVSSTVESSAEIRGTDTPPEKVPRKIFPANLTTNDDDNNIHSLFSSIRHKFLKVDDREKSFDRNQANGGHVTVCSTSNKCDELKALPTENVAFGHLREENALNSNRKVGQGDKGCPLLVESDDDILGRPIVPRLKIVQEDSCTFEGKSNSFLLDASKRVKLLQDSKPENKKQET